MAFDARSVGNVKDACAGIQELLSLAGQTELKIGEQRRAKLVDSERDTVRARLIDEVQVLRQEIIDAVKGW